MGDTSRPFRREDAGGRAAPDPGGLNRLRAIPAELRLLAAQFFRFGTVGLVGFAVDTAIVYGLRGTLGLIGAGMVSYVVAASVTWSLNRVWTFRGRGNGPAHRQWLLFLAANLLGFVLNRGAYVALVSLVPLCAAQPILATFAGAIAGMWVNFFLSRTVVFR